MKKKRIKIFFAKNKKWKIFRTKESINEMYLKELKHVIYCIKNKKQSKIINLDYGINTLKLSNLQIKSTITGRRIYV